MKYTSFKKGEEFEKFVENELFNEKEYILVHRTNNYEQNKFRYSEDTLKPDFKFRCKKTQQEFYVEAKYRSNFNINDMIEIMSTNQLERFKKIEQTEGIPIYISIGYGGKPSEPSNLSLIPLTELTYLELYPSFLRKFNISKNIIDSRELNLWSNEPNKENSINQNENITQEKIKPSNNKKKSFKFGIAFFILLIFGLLSFNFLKSNNIEKELKQKTSEYYQTLEIGNIDDLDNYINPFVNKWYNKSNLTLSEVKVEVTKYLKKFPKSKTEIQWNSFKITPLNNDYLVSYKMIYKILSKGKFKNKIYHLKIKAIWGRNLKLKSIYEVKI